MSEREQATVEPQDRAMSHNGIIAAVVAAFAARPDVTIADIVTLTRDLRAELASHVAGGAETRRPEMGVGAALSHEEIVSEDDVLCLCCGKRFKTLKRHLMAAHGLTEAAYRARFDLPASVPLVAPSYSARRAQVASDIGFGKYDREASRRDVA